jgi:CO/xanthine dehydrogenase Mo-binding subunit
VGIDKIKLTLGDTANCPFGRGAFSSRTTLIAGRAVQLGAAELKKQLFEIVGNLLEASVDDLELQDGKVFVKGAPSQYKTIGEISKHYIKTKGTYITAIGYYDPDSTIPDPEIGQGSLSAAFIFFSHACEVEVDMETGDVKIIRYVAAHDVGKEINPMAIEGQLEGALGQGLGYALSEELKLKDGLTLNPDFSDYVMFSVADVPPIQIKIIEDPEPSGPFGAKGVGEPALVVTAPAIANAIYNATGIRIKDLPITPQKILDAIKGKK